MSKIQFKYINSQGETDLPLSTKGDFEKSALLQLHSLMDELLRSKAYIEVYHTGNEILTAVIIIPESDLDKRANKMLLKVFDK